MDHIKSQPSGMCYHKVKESEKGTNYSDIQISWNKKKLKGLISREKLHEILSVYGVVTHIFISNVDTAYASYTNNEDANKAVLDLNEKPCLLLNKRVLKACYAKLVTEQELMVLDNKVECTSDTKDVVVPGVELFQDFITMEEEKDLIANIDAAPFVQQLHRRVQHYGYKFNYQTKDIEKDSPLGEFPKMFDFVISKIVKDNVLSYKTPDQITINEYQPGQGIGHHVDTHSSFEDDMIVLSLNSSAVMTFRNNPKDLPIKKSIFLPPRSLLVIRGEARYSWEHSIPNRKNDVHDGVIINRTRRLSITMRKVRHTPCTCSWPTMCDSQFEKLAHESLAPTAIEMEHVHKVYNTIASHFSHTRYAPWPKVQAFLASQPKGSIIADVGCGNGKYLGVSKDSFAFGSDRSDKLIDICKQRGFESLVADALKLPYRSCCSDVSIAIAVAHHMSTPGHRLRLIQELARITRVGGVILLYAWALEQENDSRRRFENQDVMVPWNLQKTYAESDDKKSKVIVDDETQGKEAGEEIIEGEEKKEEGGSKINQAKAVRVDEERNSVVYQRFCHVYCEGELESLISKVDGLVVERGYYDTSNWAVVARKMY